MHISCVRGSPLIRTALVLVAMIATGFGFMFLTQNQVKPRIVEGNKQHGETKKLVRARYILTLSERAAYVEIESAGEVTSTNLSSESSVIPMLGDILINPKAPVIFLKVKWYELGDRHGFAKLAIEMDGKPTVTQVFDAEGNIDEFLELSF